MRAERMLIAYRLLALAGKHISDCTTSIANSSTCPSDVIDAVSCVIYAAPKLSEITELGQVTQQFGAKYGEQFIHTYRTNKNGTVNESLIRCFSEPDLDYDDTVEYLQRIARDYEVEWVPLTGKDPEVLGTMKPFPSKGGSTAGGTVPPAPDMSMLPAEETIYIPNNHQGGPPNQGGGHGGPGSGGGGGGFAPRVDPHADGPNAGTSVGGGSGGAGQPYYAAPPTQPPSQTQSSQQVYVPSIYPTSHLNPTDMHSVSNTNSSGAGGQAGGAGLLDDGLNKEEDLPPAYEASAYPSLYSSQQPQQQQQQQQRQQQQQSHSTTTTSSGSGYHNQAPPPGVYDSSSLTGGQPGNNDDEDDLIAKLSNLNPKNP